MCEAKGPVWSHYAQGTAFSFILKCRKVLGTLPPFDTVQ